MPEHSTFDKIRQLRVQGLTGDEIIARGYSHREVQYVTGHMPLTSVEWAEVKHRRWLAKAEKREAERDKLEGRKMNGGNRTHQEVVSLRPIHVRAASHTDEWFLQCDEAFCAQMRITHPEREIKIQRVR